MGVVSAAPNMGVRLLTKGLSNPLDPPFSGSSALVLEIKIIAFFGAGIALKTSDIYTEPEFFGADGVLS